MSESLLQESVAEAKAADPGRDRVDQIAAQAAATILAADEQWLASVEEGIFGGLAQLGRELIAANEAAVAKLRDAESDAASLRSAVIAYRSAIAEDVVGKTGRYLRSTPPEERATIALLTAIGSMTDLAAKFPETVTVSADPGPYGADEADGFIRSIRKAFVRMSTKLTRKERRRRIPVRLLADYHLQVRVPRRFAKRHRACLIHLCSMASEFEAVLAEWTHGVLEIEEALDDPAHYTPDDFHVAPEETDSLDELTADLAALSEALTEGIARFVDNLAFKAPSGSLDEAEALFRFDLRYAGTFMLREADRVLPSRPYLPVSLIESDHRPWTDWFVSARNHIRLNWHLLNLRTVFGKRLRALAEGAASETVRPLRDAHRRFRERLEELHTRADEMFAAAAEESKTGGLLTGALPDLRLEIDAFMAEIVGAEGSDEAAEDFLNEFGDGEGVGLAAAFKQLPGPRQIRRSDSSALALELGLADYGEVDLKSIADWMLGLRYVDQVRGHSDRLRLTVTRKWIDLEQAAEVVRFGLSAAEDEIRDPIAGEEDSSSPGHRIDRARELAVDGFSRAIDMSDNDEEIRLAWGSFIDGVIGIGLRDWAVLHRQVHSAEMAQEWTGLWDRINRGFQGSWVDLRKTASEWIRKADTLIRLGRRHAHSLIRRGRSAVGVSRAAREERLETIDAVVKWRDLHEGLPLVYRRLFSFEPLTDEAHLVNRTADLSVVRTYYDRWCRGLPTNALVISCPAGSGRSTFVNVIERSVFADADVRRVEMANRHISEESLAKEVADSLGLNTESPASFARVEEAIHSRPSKEKSLVCIVDNLEHALMRLPGGSQLLESLLILMSRTDQVVCWIGCIGRLPRHFLERTLSIGGFIELYSLAPFNETTIRELLLTRHKKSGLPLQFQPPDDIGPIMKQRLRRAPDESQRQEILGNAFFEKLHRESGQNLRLAIYYWLRSIDFTNDSEPMSIRSVNALSVDFLNDVDLRSAFSLKAILFHRTLTIEEHNKLFRMGLREGTVVLESLLNSGLIIPVGRPADDLQPSIEPDVRYTLQPLLIHPVTELLKSRHMIY